MSEAPASPQADPGDAAILLIEDNNIVARQMRFMLEHAGYRVISAQNGPAGMETATAAQPDLILLDVMMPGMNGYDVCRQLKQQPITADIPVIFMTALSDTQSKVAGFEAGAVDFITKPIQTAELLARLNTHLTLRNLRRGLETEIQQRERLISELDAYAHTVAHDLKGTLANIIGYAQMLVRNHDRLSPNDRAVALESIVGSGLKMRNVIDALLLLAHVRKEDVRADPLNMSRIVNDVCDRMEAQIAATGAKIRLPSEWPAAAGYAPWVEEVWFNFISNAVKYGGRPPHITLGADPVEGGMIRFWIQDNGDGIPHDQQSELFIPFNRLDQIDTKGHGLGLSIVHRIVDRLGGEVGVDSRPGQGATFFFTLRAQPA